MKKRKGRQNLKVRSTRVVDEHLKCWFCEHVILPDYKDIEVLQSFLTPRGKMLAKHITGTCAKHQRKLTKAVKLSRQMALLR